MRILGPNCLGIIVPAAPSQRQLRRHDAGPRAYRFHLPVGGALHVGARLGHRRRDRLFALRLRGQHARREHGRPDRLFRFRDGNAFHHLVCRIDRRGPRVPFRGAGLFPHEADRGLQGRTVQGIGPGRGLAHGGHGRRRCGLRSGLPAGRHRADPGNRRHVRLRRTAGPAVVAQVRPPGNRHQRRRAGRHDHRRPDRPRRPPGGTRAGDHRGAQPVPARLLVARQSGRHASATPRRSDFPGRWKPCSKTRTSMPCW